MRGLFFDILSKIFTLPFGSFVFILFVKKVLGLFFYPFVNRNINVGSGRKMLTFQSFVQFQEQVEI